MHALLAQAAHNVHYCLYFWFPLLKLEASNFPRVNSSYGGITAPKPGAVFCIISRTNPGAIYTGTEAFAKQWDLVFSMLILSWTKLINNNWNYKPFHLTLLTASPSQIARSHYHEVLRVCPHLDSMSISEMLPRMLRSLWSYGNTYCRPCLYSTLMDSFPDLRNIEQKSNVWQTKAPAE